MLVTKREMVAERIVALELTAEDGALLPPFEAGAHIDVALPNGMVRQYSLLNDPQERERYVIAVLRDPGSRGGSVCVHDDISAGMALRIGAPRNLFALRPTGGALLFAGGIGITPLLAMAHTLHREGRAFMLHYCARNRAAAAFADTLPWGERVALHVDDEAPAQRLDAKAVLATAAPGTEAYVCGPAGFIAHVFESARAVGWDEARLHAESFAPQAMTGGGFTLRLARRGTLVEVAANQSALAALLAAGVELPVSCEQGICGTCRTTVLAGEPEHRDNFLTRTEQARGNCFLPCVSRARSAELVLDL
ncbi:PDR/VanB family oxidoreductase [Acidocella sp.]|uniref:PDR/VanB family oxidoreductase n=1 Tax=Acidocella sp. TaxID=50710 RepID=UPI00262320E6|nr:PDR/VanB family oxidoreductase [Acidocella sp.]